MEIMTYICVSAADDMHENFSDVEVPPGKNIKNRYIPYTGDGNLKMDKERNCYSRDNQELIIENVFVGKAPIQEIIKEYILETQLQRINLAVRNTTCYNKNNMIVALPKEVC